jgi:hypothetical protein
MMANSPTDFFGYPNPDRPRAGRGAGQAAVNPRSDGRRQGDARRSRPRTGDARSQVNQFGRGNPYQNSTATNPSQNIPFLGTHFPHDLPRVPAVAPRAPAFEMIQPGAARGSWDLAGIAALLGPYYHIPFPHDYNLLKRLRESLPLLDGCILRMKELVGCPEVEAAPRLKQDIDKFLTGLPVNRAQFGIENWVQSHLDNMYLYGRAHAEIILTNDRRDVFGLVEVHPTTTGFRPTFDGYAVNVVQYQYGGGVPVTLVPELLLTSVNDLRGDDPNGTSLIGSLPFVGEIQNKTLRALGNTMDRFGVPSYWVNWETPDGWNDPTGDQAAAIVQPMMNNLTAAELARANGQVQNFFTNGKVTVQILGAAEQVLEYETTIKAISEQVTAKVGLPPFMFGFSWSSTERMSTAQAKMVTEIIQAARAVLTPCITQLIDLRQRLVGRTGRFELVWPKVSLQDRVDEARAEWMDQQAVALKLENWQTQVRLGIHSLEEMAIDFRDDMDGVKPAEVREILDGEEGMPNLVDEIPEPVPVQVAGMRQHGPGQLGGGNDPRDEQTRSWYAEEMKQTRAWYSEQMKQLAAGARAAGGGNGNGRH